MWLVSVYKSGKLPKYLRNARTFKANLVAPLLNKTSFLHTICYKQNIFLVINQIPYKSLFSQVLAMITTVSWFSGLLIFRGCWTPPSGEGLRRGYTSPCPRNTPDLPCSSYTWATHSTYLPRRTSRTWLAGRRGKCHCGE